MNGFHDVRFPTAIGLRASGGPERRVRVVALADGREERSAPWRHSRRRFDVGYGLRSLDELEQVIAFYEARRGRLFAFRFRDPMDWKSCAPSGEPGMLDQPIGIGDGAAVRFALIKRYASGGAAYDRPVTLPISGTVSAAVDGAAAAVTVEGGEIVFSAPPPAGAVVTAGFAFDLAARFDSDRLEIDLDAFSAGAAPSIPIVEVRL